MLFFDLIDLAFFGSGILVGMLVITVLEVLRNE